MRILHVIQGYWPWVGGSQRFFQEISERLVAEGHQVTVWTSDAGELEHFWAPGRRTVGPAHQVLHGVEVRRFPVRRRLNHPLLFSLYRRLMAELSDLPLNLVSLLQRLARFTPHLPDLEAWAATTEEPFDLVHGGNITLDFFLWPVFELARRRGIPWMITPFTHLGAPGQRRVRRYYTMQQQRFLVQQAAAVVTQTSLESTLWAGLGVPRERLFVTGSGVNPAAVVGGDGERFRQRYGLEGPIVFALGTLAADKGTLDTLRAMERLWARGRSAHLVLAGQAMSPVRAYLERLPADRAGRVHLLGFISEEEKRDLLAAGDILCLPSCTDSFGIVYLEAWLNGIPVIGARAGGVPDVITNGVDGILVEFGNVPALARSLARLLDDPGLRREMGRRGREKVLRRMTWDHVYERSREAYQFALGGKNLPV